MEHLAAVQARIASIEGLVRGVRPAAPAALTRTGSGRAPAFHAALADAMAAPAPVEGGLRAPVDAPVSSSFGPRTHPVTRERHHHAGVDFAAPEGTPVRAIAAGVVEFAGERGGYGNLVIVRHAGGSESRYAHQRELAVGAGERVEAGQVLGAVGSTGRSTGPHLHLEIRRDGVPVDPLPLLRGG